MKVVDFTEVLRVGSYVRALLTFAGFVLLVLELLGQFVMLIGRLVQEVFEGDDLPCIFEHVFLHFVEDDILNMLSLTLSSCSFSLMFDSSCVCLILRR